MATMTESTTDNAQQDLAGSRINLAKYWGTPIAMWVLGGVWHAATPVLWPISFLWIGAACSANALRCHRVHCTIMGPAFLVLALVSLLNAVGVVALSWSLLGTIAAATVLIAYLPEFAGLKYFGRTPAS